MKKQLLITALFFSFLVTQAQQYYVGVPVNQTLSSWSIADLNSCYPQYAVDVYIGTSPYVTGVKLAFIITAINATAASVNTSPGSIIAVGDTLLLPSGSINGGYQFFFASGGSASMDLIAYGTPQIANEQYDCPLNQALYTISPCQKKIHIQSLGGTCNVTQATYVQPVSNEHEISIYPNPSNGIFTIETKEKEFELIISNVLGEKVYPPAGRAGSITNPPIDLPIAIGITVIDISNQPNGIYFLHIKTEQESYIQKLIISK